MGKQLATRSTTRNPKFFGSAAPSPRPPQYGRSPKARAERGRLTLFRVTCCPTVTPRSTWMGSIALPADGQSDSTAVTESGSLWLSSIAPSGNRPASIWQCSTPTRDGTAAADVLVLRARGETVACAYFAAASESPFLQRLGFVAERLTRSTLLLDLHALARPCQAY